MKNYTLIFIALFTLNYCYSQKVYPLNTLKVKLKSGKISKKGKYYCFDDYLVNEESGKRIEYSEIQTITHYSKSDSIHLETISYHHRGNNLKGLGSRVYKDQMFTIYHIVFTLSFREDYIYKMKNFNYENEIFIKRNHETKLYSVGFADGYGWRNIRKRLTTFFSDCSTLKKALRKGLVNEKDIFSVLKFYKNNCNH